MATVKLIQETRKSLLGALQEGDLAKATAILRNIPSLVTNPGPQPFLQVAVNAPSNSHKVLCLLLRAGANVNAQDASGVTALHVAAGRGNAKCLLEMLQAGGDVNLGDNNGLIPLHYAARSRREGAVTCLQLLLKYNSPCNVSANHGITPLHVAVEVSNLTATKILLKSGASHRNVDYRGYTALHFATSPTVADALLADGADATTTNMAGHSVLQRAINKYPNLVPTLLSSGLAVQGDPKEHDLRVFFSLDLLCDSSQSEVELINSMAVHGYYDFLKHPLCEAFLHLKWLRVWPLFYLKLAVFISLVTTLTGSLCLWSYLPLHENISTTDIVSFVMLAESHSALLMTSAVLQGLAGVLWAIIMIREVLQMIISRKYWVKLEKWIQLPFLVMSVVIIATTGSLQDWQRHIGVLAILLGWYQITFLLGHLPGIGIYVQMFHTVSIRMLTFASVYSSLFIGFAVSFHLVFNEEVFSTVWTSGLKTLAMMVGELDFSSILGNGDKPTLNGTAQFIFVLFVLLMTVVITNLLVGLAVQDIQMLQKEAGVSRLALTVEQETSVDIMLSSRLLRCIMPRYLLTWIQNKCSLLHHLPRRSIQVSNAAMQGTDSDTCVDWWIRRGTKACQRGPMEHYNIFICPYDPVTPGKVYFSSTTKLIPTGYTLPDWIVKNTRTLLENGLHAKEYDDLSDDDSEDEVKETNSVQEKQTITLDSLQEQIQELQKSVTAMTQLLKKTINSK
ncbi:hypothetical protein SK128_018044 [Halocaridina rubra]|uniref:Ion transport domain-containing protein n=1 Tax=Halocaridina rubra TaxID=373956 RepID=A0AAN9A9E3_HALRR